jgi:hypothetical protein
MIYRVSIKSFPDYEHLLQENYVARPRSKHCYHHASTLKPEVATAVVELLMMGVRTPETC